MEEECTYASEQLPHKEQTMTCCLPRFVQPVLALLLLVTIHAQSCLSAVRMDLHYKFNEHSKSNHFGYGKQSGPATWVQTFHTCGGHSQSPVNLDTTTAVTRHHPRIIWWNYSLKPAAMTVTNNGHTVLLMATWARKEDCPYHWSAQTSEEYVFQQVHFHWGEDDQSGSEHTLNNERFALEMHVVHYRRDLSSLEEAGNYAAGIRVIGVFFRVSEVEHNYTALQQVVQALQAVRSAGYVAVIAEPFPLSRLVPEFSNLYMTYNGSLTTPPCSESVTWVIRKEPLTVSRHQVDEFRSLLAQDGRTIKRNCRPTQPLNGRIVVQIR